MVHLKSGDKSWLTKKFICRDLPPDIASAMTASISATQPPEQGVRERTEPLKILAFKAGSNFPRCQPVSRAGNGGFYPVSRDCWSLAKRGMNSGEITGVDHDRDIEIPI
jgi:hypothetical protein